MWRYSPIPVGVKVLERGTKGYVLVCNKHKDGNKQPELAVALRCFVAV